MSQPLTVTPQQAAALTGYSVTSIRRLIAAGDLVVSQPRRRILIDYSSILNLLAGKTAKSPPPPEQPKMSFTRRRRLTPNYDAF